MRHLLFLVMLLALGTPALTAPQPYFRVVTSNGQPPATSNPDENSVPVVPPASDTTGPIEPSLPPGMSGGVPTAPNMDPTASTEARSVGFVTEKLPGWQFDIATWKGVPALSNLVVQAQGSYALVAFQVRVRGCATATVLLETSGTTTFQRTRDTTACALPTPEEWASVAGQPMPGLVRVVSSAGIPDLNQFPTLGNGYTFSPVY